MAGCVAVRGVPTTTPGLSAARGTMCRMVDRDPAARPPGDAPPDPDTAGHPPGHLPDHAEHVLSVAERIPPGRVMTYGDVAEWLLGEGVAVGGPRQVGRVMAEYGGAVPWWRVVRADGVPLPGHESRALAHYRAEGTPLRPAGSAARGRAPRIDMRRARWDGGAGEPGPAGVEGRA